MFEWDKNKNQANLEKHGISFEVAVEVFNDNSAHETDRTINNEARIMLIGEVCGFVLVVVFTYRNNKRRIISARRASKAERKVYYDNKN